MPIGTKIVTNKVENELKDQADKLVDKGPMDKMEDKADDKKDEVIRGTDNAFRWAKQHKVKLLWGTDFLFNPEQNKNQNKDILKLKQWFTPAEALKLVTHDNAQVLLLSGPRNPYPGKLGVVATGALADLLLVDSDPLANLDLLADPAKNFVVIMKDGKVYKNLLRP